MPDALVVDPSQVHSITVDASDVQAAPEHSILADIGGTLHQYWQKVNPLTMAQSASGAIMHPLDAAHSYGQQNAQLGQSAMDAFKSGDYGSGVRHALSYFLNGVPGLGAALDEAGNKAASGDTKGAIADTAALATQIAAGVKGPAIVEAAPEAAATAGTVVKGAVTGAAKAAVEPVRYGHLALPIPAPLAGAAAGGYAGRMIGLPHEAGAVVGAAYPIVRGAVSGAKSALATRAVEMEGAAAMKSAQAANPYVHFPQETADELLRESEARKPPEAAEPTEVTSPAPPTAIEAPTAPTVAQQLADEMVKSGTATPEQAPTVSTEAFKGVARANRTDRAQGLAAAFHQADIPAEDLHLLSPEDWKNVAAAHDVEFPSTKPAQQKLIDAVIKEKHKMEAAPTQ